MSKKTITYDDFLKNYIKNQLNNLKGKEIETNEFLNSITEPLRSSDTGYLFPCIDDAIRFISRYSEETKSAIEKMTALNNLIDPIDDAQLFIDFMVDIDSSNLLTKSETIIELINNNEIILINDDVIKLISEDLNIQ